jgi:hypothetical protein
VPDDSQPDNRPLVSVVIPTYMRAAGVARALDSIDEPRIDLGRIEVIVVDNASTDDTEAVVEARRERFPNLVFRRWPENVGPIENWRRGIALARAPWLKVIWSDDCLMPGAIAVMIDAATRNSAQVVTCRVAIDYPDGRSAVRYLDRSTTLTPDVVASELLHFPAGLPSSPGAALVRTEDARAALASDLPDPCWQKAIGPDLLITYWAVFNGGSGVHQPDVLARFAAGQDSITVRTRRAVLSSCYGAALDRLITMSDVGVSLTTTRRLRSRAAMDSMLGGVKEALISPRRLSGRATVYDTYQLTRYWFTTQVLRRRTI